MRYYLGHVDPNSGAIDSFLKWQGPAVGFVERQEQSNATWWSSLAAARRNLFKYVTLVDAGRNFEICALPAVPVRKSIADVLAGFPEGTPAREAADRLKHDVPPAASFASCTTLDHCYPAGADNKVARGTACFCGKRVWGGDRPDYTVVAE